MKRELVVKDLARAAAAGNLGFFVGSGFGKALTGGKAPTWGALLAEVAKALELSDPYKNPTAIIGRSFPTTATFMLEELATKLSTEKRFKDADPVALRAEATTLLKMEVARQVALEGEPTATARFRAAFGKIRPAWFMTTNYDFLIEQVVEHHDSLLPQQVFRSRRACTPVFHLHGHRHSPSTIVITEEDYSLLLPRPDYRFVKLSLLLAESMTVLMGYALGDINVQTAVHLARALSPNSTELHGPEQGRLVFVEWIGPGKTPEPEARVGRYGELIIQAVEIVDFIDELASAYDAVQAAWKKAQEEIDKLASRADFPAKFIENATFRAAVIKTLTVVPGALPSSNVAGLLLAAFEDIAAKAGKPGNFSLYAKWLSALLDVLEGWPIGSMSPLLFQVLAQQLAAVMSSVYEEDVNVMGYSWDATHTWHQRAKDLVAHEKLYQALLDHAQREDALVLARRLRALKPKKS